MKKISKKDRQILKMKFGGRCAYCGQPLFEKFHLDHVKAVYRDNEKKEGARNPENHYIENLYPSCIPCNLLKTVYSIEEFRNQIKEQPSRAIKSSVNHRTALRFGLIEHKQKEIKFWFEEYDENLRPLPAL